MYRFLHHHSAPFDAPREAIAAKLIARYGLYDDKVAVKYLNLIGKSLLLTTRRSELPWRFNILDTEEINAFACPGGPIFITRGLWENLDSEAELAGILGHEMAHITRRDTIEDMRKLRAMETLNREFFGETGIPLDRVVNYAIDNILMKGFSQEAELAADELGTRYAAALGYFPGGLRDFLDRVLERRTRREVGLGSLYSSYPSVDQRVTRLSELYLNEFYGNDNNPQLGDRLEYVRQHSAARVTTSP